MKDQVVSSSYIHGFSMSLVLTRGVSGSGMDRAWVAAALNTSADPCQSQTLGKNSRKEVTSQRDRPGLREKCELMFALFGVSIYEKGLQVVYFQGLVVLPWEG